LSFNVNLVGLSDFSGIQLYGPSGAVNGTSVATSSSAVAGVGAQEKLRIIFDDAAVDRILQVGTPKTYSLRATTISTLTANNTETVSIRLLSDTGEAGGVPDLCTGSTAGANMTCVRILENSASTTDRFIWSPNSTTTLSAATASNSANDWTNSYGLPGFPTVGQDMSTRVFTH